MSTIKRVTALTRHKPWHAGTRLRRLSGPRLGLLALCAAWLGTLAIASGAAAAAAGVNIAAVEGQSFTGTVVGGLVCPLASATISWGDGTTSAGTSDGSSGIQGTHTYAEEGTYAGSVSFTYTLGGVFSCPTGVQTASFQASVQDAALTWLGRNLAGTAGQSVGGVVAHFSDANPAAGVGDFSAQITWGDGTSSSGSVSAAAGGGFDVSGSHAYTSAGSYTVSVAIADAGGSTATTSSTAQIAPAPPPPPQLTARFVVNPGSPCPLTTTFFDARDSTLVPGATFTGYSWDIEGTDSGTVSYGSPVFDATGQLPYETVHYTSLGQATHQAPGFPPTVYNLFDMHLLSPPVQVTLEVDQNVPGRGLIGATQTKTITFTNPDIQLEIGFPGYGFGKPPVWIVNPQQQHGCPAFTNRRFFGIQKVKGSVALAKLAAHSPVVLSSRRSIKLRVGCPNPVKDCLASLDVLSGAPKLSRAKGRRHSALPPSIGTRTFVVSAGKNITVTVPLNARGRALAHAHHLHQVTLLLGSVGGLGKIIPTIRTIRLRTGR